MLPWHTERRARGGCGRVRWILPTIFSYFFHLHFSRFSHVRVNFFLLPVSLQFFFSFASLDYSVECFGVSEGLFSSVPKKLHNNNIFGRGNGKNSWVMLCGIFWAKRAREENLLNFQSPNVWFCFQFNNMWKICIEWNFSYFIATLFWPALSPRGGSRNFQSDHTFPNGSTRERRSLNIQQGKRGNCSESARDGPALDS